MSIKTEITLDITSFLKNLDAVAGQTKKTADDVAAAFKKGVKVDPKQLNDLTDGFRAAQTQSSLFLTQQKEIARALIYSGKQGTSAYIEVEKNIKEAAAELKKFDSINDQVNKSLDKTPEKANAFKTAFSGMFSGLAMGGGMAIAQQGIQLVTQGVTELWNQALKADEISASMEIGFRNAGLTGAELAEQIKNSEIAARKLGFSIGVAPERLKTLAALAGTLGGATGKMNDQFVKAAIGIEKATGGLTSGEAAIKLFSKGISDPENVEALSRLKSQFPKLAAELIKITDPTKKAQKAIELLAGTYLALKNDLADAGSKMEQFKIIAAEAAQSFGGSFLENFDINSILAMFGEVDIYSMLDSLKQAGKDLAEFVTGLAKVVVTYVQGYWAYLDNAFVKPLSGVFDTLMQLVEPFTNLFKELFGGGASQGLKFIDVMAGIGKVVGFIVNVAFIPLKMIVGGVTLAINGLVWWVQMMKQKFDETYKSSALFRNIIGFIADAFKGASYWIGKVIDGVSKFFSALGKKPDTKAMKEVSDETKKTNDEVTNLKDNLGGELPPPKTEKAKKEFTNLADYIQGLKAKISDIDFNMKLSNEDAVIRDVEKQIKDVAQNVSLSESAKIDLSVKLETRKAILENEKELQKLAEANKKTIEGIEKDFEDKKKGASKSDILIAEKAKNKLLAAETDKYHSDSFDLLMKFYDLTENIQSESTKKKVDLAKKEIDFLRVLQIDSITDEKKRNYEKELDALQTKFDNETALYKGNKEIVLALENKFINDFWDLQDKFNAAPSSNLEAIKGFADVINKQIQESTADTTDVRKTELKKQTDDLENSLRSQTFSYSNYIDTVKKLEEERVAIEREASASTIEIIAQNLRAAVNAFAVGYAAYETYSIKRSELDVKEKELKTKLENEALTDKAERTAIEKELDAVRMSQKESDLDVAGSILGTTKGMFKEQTAAYKAMAIAEAGIATYLGATKAAARVEMFPFNWILAGLITAAGLANIAKIAGIGGASEGVVDLSNKNKGRPGYGDSIPMMLRRGESVINPEGTSKYKDIIKQINAGTYNYKADSNAGRIGLAIDKSGTLTEHKEKQYVNEIVGLKGVINELTNKISNMSTNSHSRMDFEFSNHSEISGGHLNLVSDKTRKKAIKRYG